MNKNWPLNCARVLSVAASIVSRSRTRGYRERTGRRLASRPLHRSLDLLEDRRLLSVQPMDPCPVAELTAAGVIGDVTGDGRFDSSDLVQVLQRGQFEDQIDGNSDYCSGDWNGDGDFDTGDLILALQEGHYEMPLAAGKAKGPKKGGSTVDPPPGDSGTGTSPPSDAPQDPNPFDPNTTGLYDPYSDAGWWGYYYGPDLSDPYWQEFGLGS